MARTSDPPESGSVWRDISRMEAELNDPDEQATTHYNRPRLLEMLRRAREQQAQEAEISVEEIATPGPSSSPDSTPEQAEEVPPSLPSQHRPSSAPPVRARDSTTSWFLFLFLVVLLAMLAVMFL